MNRITEEIIEIPIKHNQTVVELDLPVGSAIRHMWPWAEKSKIAGGGIKASIRMLVAMDDTQPLVRRRLAVLMQGGEIPAVIAQQVTWLCSNISPSGVPMSLYEFPLHIPGIDDVEPPVEEIEQDPRARLQSIPADAFINTKQEG